MKKKMFLIYIIVLMIPFFIFVGCGTKGLTLTSFNKGFGLKYDENKNYPVVIISGRIELDLFSTKYREHIDFGVNNSNEESIDKKIKQFDLEFFSDKYLAVQIRREGVPAGVYHVSYEKNDMILNIKIKYSIPSQGNTGILLSFFILEIPKSIECSNVNFIIENVS